MFCFFKQKTAYEMRISDWSSDVCSSDLVADDLDTLQCLDVAVHIAHLQPRLVQEFGQILGHALGQRGDEGAVSSGGGLFRLGDQEIGRASCRERVCQYV